MKKTLSVLLSLIMIVGLIIIPASGVSNAKNLTVLFTHDLHSHIDTVVKDNNGQITETGGLAKIKTLINNVKSENKDTLLVDAGDFAMGTLYQSVYATEALELRMLGVMGYDATTLGNHEFDYNSGNLAKMINSAKAKGENLPALLASNINWEKSTSPNKNALKQAFENYGVEEEYTIIQKGNVKIALFGILGEDAVYYSPNSNLEFDNFIDSAKQTVSKIKQNENVDMIVCLSHSGTSDDKKKSEDEILAQKVPEIDVIVSGHTHTVIDKPIVYGNTYVVSCGEYGKNLGRLDLTQKQDGRWSLDQYNIIPVDNSVLPDTETLRKIDEFKNHVKVYLQRFGYSEYDQVIGYSPYQFDDVYSIEHEVRNHDLPSLITDGYIHAVKNAEGNNYKNIDVALVPAGVIRSTFSPGRITVADVYEVSALGIGNDNQAGYPLVSMYLTGEELKLIAELDATMAESMPSIQFFTTGLRYEYNSHRIKMTKVTDAKLVRENGQLQEINDNQLYRVVTGKLTAQMLDNVRSQSYSILSIIPKDSNGNPITDLNRAIIYDKNNKELKEWYALSSYIESFDKQNGISTIPEKYKDGHNNKIRNDSRNPFKLLVSPSKIFDLIGKLGNAAIINLKNLFNRIF